MSRPLLFSSLLLSAFVAVGCASVGADETAQGESDLSSDPLAKIRLAVKDVEVEHVIFAADVTSPTGNAGDGTRSNLTSLYGVDWFQKWGGGVSSDHDWSKGTLEGQRCMWASLARFDAIMKDAPPELAGFAAAFYNLNDDYAGKSADGEPAYGDAKGARLSTWRTTGLSKWISATAKDGSCYLPTRKMLIAYATTCAAQLGSKATEECETTSDP